MKKKLICCLSLLVIFSVLLWLLFISYHMTYHANYRIEGTITDTDGNPLNGVYLDREYNVLYTTLPLIRSRGTVNSDFRISGSRSSRVTLRFFKKGYYPEERSFEIGKFWFRKNIRITMKPSEQMGVSEFHTFQFEEKQKYICDLSDLDHGIIQAQTVELETNPGTKHLEFDFRRDENGDIMFSEPESTYSDPMPEAFIIRLHSDDPDDGLIATSGSYVVPNSEEDVGITLSGKLDNITVKEYIPSWTIPETGYGKREIVIESPSRDLDAVFFLKCGDHFGKGEMLNPRAWMGFERKSATLKFELDINKEKGDRKLRPELKDDYVPRLYY